MHVLQYTAVVCRLCPNSVNTKANSGCSLKLQLSVYHNPLRTAAALFFLYTTFLTRHWYLLTTQQLSARTEVLLTLNIFTGRLLI